MGCSRLLDFVNQVVGGILRRHAGIYKADEVGEGMVAEDHIHPRVAVFVAIDGVELVGEIGIQVDRSHRAKNRLPRLRPRTPSSVAIHLMPSSQAIDRVSSETLPSDGHAPFGRTPKTFL